MTERVGGPRRVALRCMTAFAAAVAGLGPVCAQTVAVLSSNGVRAPLEELMAQCTSAAGQPVAVAFGTSSSIRQRIGNGEAVFATSEIVAELAKGERLATASITPLGRAGIGIGVRENERRFEVGNAEALKQTFLAVRSVTYAQDGASRPHIERMFERLGIAAEMKAKTLLEQGSVRAAERVVAGEAEILLTLVSEILPVAGLELLGPLPHEFQSYISFAASVGTQAASADAARAFIDCVAAPASTPAFAAQGIER
jgi:molybdate transport system substrate-binding protein